MKKKSSLGSKGFTVVEGLIILVVVAVIAVTGTLVYRHNHDTANAGSWQLLGYNKVFFPLHPSIITLPPRPDIANIVLKLSETSHVTVRDYTCYEDNGSNVTYGMQATLGPLSNGKYLNAIQNKFILFTARTTYTKEYTVYVGDASHRNAVPRLETVTASGAVNLSSNWSNQAIATHSSVPEADASSAQIYVSVTGINHYNTTVDVNSSKIKTHC